MALPRGAARPLPVLVLTHRTEPRGLEETPASRVPRSPHVGAARGLTVGGGPGKRGTGSRGASPSL